MMKATVEMSGPFPDDLLHKTFKDLRLSFYT